MQWSPEWVIIAVTTVVGAMATAAVKIIGALKGVETKVDALEIKVDGRLTQLLARTEEASRAQGLAAGRGEMIVPSQRSLAPVVGPDHLIVEIPAEPPPIVLLPTKEKENETRDQGDPAV